MKRCQVTPRRAVLAAIGFAGLFSAIYLGLDPRDLTPGRGGLRLAARAFGGALAPALSYEGTPIPQSARPLLVQVFWAALATLKFAIAAAAISAVAGLALGFFASTAWWADDRAGGSGAGRRTLRRTLGPIVYGATRIAIGFARSIHELIWAVIFLSAMGLTDLAAVAAIAIPFTGTLAKVFSEMIDEAPRDAAHALRAAGASPLQVFFIGLFPRALPDLTAYALYRFECALRSAAVLGFFGIPTLGYHLRLSFENTHYREVWTYLYALIALVVAVDWWSGAVRRRMAR